MMSCVNLTRRSRCNSSSSRCCYRARGHVDPVVVCGGVGRGDGVGVGGVGGDVGGVVIAVLLLLVFGLMLVVA